MKHAAGALVFCLATLGSVQAQPIYRCGNVYSQTPCPQGRIVDATDPRTEAQRAEARSVAADDRRRATEMRRDRLADQAALKPGGASSLSGSAPVQAKAASAAGRSHPTKKRRAGRPVPTSDVIVFEPAPRARRGGA
ncbi:MAG: hypothetical protein KGL99_18555 [Burkholderiales bacterium]|nr:hypothetical protein [Burkholderiales bacterium]MDE2298424.1 hypothetical protein [Burkholderiales bacterium]MDE2629153.1 hypothetical protein [Burkholderiales bacterium]